MRVERVIFGEYRANSYLVYENNEAILIDASLNVEKLTECLEKNEAQLKAVFLTHAHFDHMINLKQIIEKFDIKVYAHNKALVNMQDQHKNMSDITSEPFVIEINENFVGLLDGDKVKCLSDKEIECFETPGHCESSMCFKIDNELFTGDTLFKGSFGRFDFPLGSFKELKESIKLLFSLDDNVIIYPGHGENSVISIEKSENMINFY